MSPSDTATAAANPQADGMLRAGTWTLLGHLLAAAPDAGVLQRLRQIDTENVQQQDALALAWSKLREAADQEQQQSLEMEYQDVFIGVGSGEVTPYASWYLTGSLMDRPLVELRKDLAALGVQRQEGVSEPEDHVAAICDVMALAITDEDVDADWQRELFLRHVDQWMIRFFEDLRAAPSADFYKAVGEFGEAFVRLEQRYFAMSV
ncbi:MAG: molecular chaperone TorD family protein [Ectothiorhodospiraceae bacterium]|nr:molecular chaperone TorD family protein [Ectothiorhodospiraceae bacterium]